jgi:hypothetical protein
MTNHCIICGEAMIADTSEPYTCSPECEIVEAMMDDFELITAVRGYVGDHGFDEEDVIRLVTRALEKEML